MKTRTHTYIKRGPLITCIAWLLMVGSKAAPLDDWTYHHVPGNLSGITYGKGMFVAVGHEPGGIVSGRGTNIILSSCAGTNWTIQRPGGDGLAGGTLKSVTFGDGWFVAVGDHDDVIFGPAQSTILTSIDGLSWIDRSPQTNILLNGVTWGNGLFVAVGSEPNEGFGKVLTSPDGSNWSAHDLEPANPWQNLIAVIWGKGLFVAIGYDSVFTSSDGIRWTNEVRFGHGLGSFTDVTIGNNRFVAVGRYGWGDHEEIRTSDEGMQWAPAALPVDDYPGIRKHLTVTYGNGMFVAREIRSVLTSPDGLNWTRRSADFYNTDWGADSVFGEDTFIVVGGGTIFRSGKIGPRLQPGAAPNGDGFEFNLLGEAGRSYQIEGSRNLRDWTFVTTLTATNSDGTVRFVESDRMDPRRHFYRAVSR